MAVQKVSKKTVSPWHSSRGAALVLPAAKPSSNYGDEKCAKDNSTVQNVLYGLRAKLTVCLSQLEHSDFDAFNRFEKKLCHSLDFIAIGSVSSSELR